MLHRLRLTHALAVAALVLAATSAGAAAAPRPAQQGRCAPARQTGRFFVTLPEGGVQRNALVNVPRGVGARQVPLMLVFHGAGGTGPVEEASAGLTRLGDRDRFITVYPTSHTKFWNDSGQGPHGSDDVNFIRDLLTTLDTRVCFDSQRIYVVGVSNGGGFAARLACELSDRVRAVTIIAGLYGVQPPCTPSRPVSILEIHGTADRTVPYDGWGPNGLGSVAAFLGEWTGFDRCSTRPSLTLRYARRATLYDYDACAGGTLVAAIKLIGGIHAWPGSRGTPGPPVDHYVSATEAAWHFFLCSSSSARPCPAPQR